MWRCCLKPKESPGFARSKAGSTLGSRTISLSLPKASSRNPLSFERRYFSHRHILGSATMIEPRLFPAHSSRLKLYEIILSDTVRPNRRMEAASLGPTRCRAALARKRLMEPGFNYSRRDPKSKFPSFRVSPWVGSIHVYVDDVDAVYGQAIRLGAKTMSRQKTYRTTSAKRALSIREVTRGGCRLKADAIIV